MENRKSKRSVRLALVLGAAVAGTALVGWGGLAAWQAYTQNSGNAFSVGTLSHTNVVTGTGVTCNSTKSSAQASLTPCSVIVSGSILTSAWAGSTGTVTIQNTGQLPTTFQVSSPSADSPTGALCANLNLTVTGADSVTPYVSQAGIGVVSPTPLNTSAGSSSWAPGASNAFTFAVTPATGFANNNSVPGESCSFDVLFTQASA
jgi:hypothetical protein